LLQLEVAILVGLNPAGYRTNFVKLALVKQLNTTRWS